MTVVSHDKMTANLERPVSFRTAVKKLAAIRGDEGRAGGWIYNRHGQPIAQGWDAYGQLVLRTGLICQDAEHDGGNGKWYVWVLGFNADQHARAVQLFGVVTNNPTENA